MGLGMVWKGIVKYNRYIKHKKIYFFKNKNIKILEDKNMKNKR